MENLCIVRMYDRVMLSIWKQLVIVVHTFQDEEKIESVDASLVIHLGLS